ncbi:hypothetical protein F4604DRAFT_1799726 [Suillus subluteus]|nr:hypothetical protein F4604DRAFT_1799726 [Suillus subluteus]
MTLIYLSVRYVGIGYAVVLVMLLDLSGLVVYDALDWTSEVVYIILGGELYTSVMLALACARKLSCSWSRSFCRHCSCYSVYLTQASLSLQCAERPEVPLAELFV